MTTAFDTLLDSYCELADSERMRANHFEQYLWSGGVQALQYKWPGFNELPDTGNVLFAARTDGGSTVTVSVGPDSIVAALPALDIVE